MLGLLVEHLQALAHTSFPSENFDVAFLVHAQTVHWTARPPPDPHEPHSAVTDLIQALFQRLHDQSFFVLRERIFTTGVATDFDRALIKVTAKRMTDQVSPVTNLPLETALADLKFVFEKPAPVDALAANLAAYWQGPAPESDEDWLKLCARFADSVDRGQVLHRYHRPLAALIVSADGRLLSAATHQGALDKTQHAELRAVQTWYASQKAALPDDCRIYVSLKPCRMCAAALARCASNADTLKIIYLDDDPGPHARQTVLSSQVVQKSASALTVVQGETEAFSKQSRSLRRD